MENVFDKDTLLEARDSSRISKNGPATMLPRCSIEIKLYTILDNSNKYKFW